MTTEQDTPPILSYGIDDPDPIDMSQWTTVPPHMREMVTEEDEQSSAELNAGLSQMIEASRPEVPLIEDPPEGTAQLLWGIERDGKRYRTALVRELNGADEEAIARLSPDDTNYNVMVIDLHLRCGVVQIGPVDLSDDHDPLGELLVPDRDILFKEILLATYGTTRDYEGVPCPSCKFEMDLHIDIEGLIEVVNDKEFDNDHFAVTLRNGSAVLMRYVTGNDQMTVFRNMSKSLSAAEANTAFLATCVEKVNGKPVADPEKWARELGILDRKKIVNDLLDIPSIGFKEVEVPCQRCGKPLPTAFGWADLLPS